MTRPAATLHGPARLPERSVGRAATARAYLAPAGTVRIVVEDCDNDKELWVTLDVKEAARLRDHIAEALRIAGVSR